MPWYSNVVLLSTHTLRISHHKKDTYVNMCEMLSMKYVSYVLANAWPWWVAAISFECIVPTHFKMFDCFWSFYIFFLSNAFLCKERERARTQSECCHQIQVLRLLMLLLLQTHCRLLVCRNKPVPDCLLEGLKMSQLILFLCSFFPEKVKPVP